MFERFRQADASTTRPAKGLGLGLSIVKHLVELHGGTVQATSRATGAGRPSLIHLPLTAVHRGAGPSDRRHPKGPRSVAAEFKRLDLSGIKVLVVDDQDGRARPDRARARRSATRAW